MKFFFFKKKSSKSAKKRTTTTDNQQKRNTVGGFWNADAQHPVAAVSGHGQSGSQSPSYSISSASTQSSLHTIQHAQQEETRGIFRTLEPVWSYLPDQHVDHWLPLDSDNQRVLESAFTAKQQSTCTISLNHRPLIPTNIGTPAAAAATTTVYFYPKNKSPPPANTSSKKRRRPPTHFFALSPPSPCLTQRTQQMKSSPNLAAVPQKHKILPSTSALSQQPSVTDGLYLHQNLRRALVPYWWFETENSQIARFDWKNQVRLEALSEGRSTLTLTDASFPVPFQVVLEQTDRSLREECCGLMYLNTSHINPSHTSKHNTHDPFVIPHTDTDIHHDDTFLNRRCSI